MELTRIYIQVDSFKYLFAFDIGVEVLYFEHIIFS